jgi:radical SAM protein with 4Fe4S-binding SPASM domain
MIYVQTNGKCYACCDSVESEIHLIGDIQNGISFPVVDLSQTICGECQYIKVCGGRCGRMHKEFTSNHINEYCEMNKTLYLLIEKALPEIEEIIIKYPEYKRKITNPIFAYTEYTS